MRGCRKCKSTEAMGHQNWCGWPHPPFEDITVYEPPYGKPFPFFAHKRPSHKDPAIPWYSHFCDSEWQLALCGNLPVARVTLP